ncbi:MAG: hypothetical protein HKN99_05670 [Winogradskyella sp.]|nr:restriction endonuclease subunit S [Bacteroidia bacterium]NNC45352.1 hypothetical protein [Winogradskyella sp.]NNK60952.1 hypothetical protein [Flavobacteriaceae bacterium]
MMQVQLGNSVEVITKGTTPTTLGKDFKESGIKFLRAQNVINGKVLLNDDILYIDENTHYSELKRSQIKKGDVLLTIAGTIGRTAIVSNDEPLNCNQAVAIIRLGDSDINPSFLCHFIASKNAQSQFIKGKVTATISNLSLGQIKKLKIPLPPLDQQKQIASILDTADAYRQKTKALIEKYDALTQSLFLDMFGDPVTNPKGWKNEILQKCLIKVDKIGKSYDKNKIEYVDIASIDNVSNVVTKTTAYLTKDRPSRAQQILCSGDVLFSTVRPNLKNIAINMIDGRIGTTGFFVCRTNSHLLSNHFLFNVFLTDSVTDYFVSMTSGANYPAIKSSEMKKFKIILPPLELQNQFADRIEAIEAQKAIAQQELDKADELFNSLLQKAFKGELV